MAEGPGPIIISEEFELNAMKGDIKCGVMHGVKCHLINKTHFCLRDPVSLEWRNNRIFGIKVIQTTNEMVPHFQIFENEVENMFFPLFNYKCKYCRSRVTFEVLQ